MDVSGMYFDRRFNEPNPLTFYLNLLATECLDFRSIHQTKRTLEFLWAKRSELAFRLRARLLRRKNLLLGPITNRESLPIVVRRGIRRID
jgi:hypothetical protein